MTGIVRSESSRDKHNKDQWSGTAVSVVKNKCFSILQELVQGFMVSNFAERERVKLCYFRMIVNENYSSWGTRYFCAILLILLLYLYLCLNVLL
jgi:hypothetical protein